MNGKIYCFTNTLTGKKYIGQTVGDVYKHFSDYANRAESAELTTPLGNAIRQYGRHAFRVEVLKEGISNFIALKAQESWFIRVHNTLVPNGYNVQS